jgi:hypothetical protein
MILIWMFLLHLPSGPVHGHFSPVEIAMTIVVGIASLLGIVAAVKTASLRVSAGVAAFVLGAVAQFACFQISKIPFIWRH